MPRDRGTEAETEAWGWVSDADIAQPLRLLDRELAMLWRLTHWGPRVAGTSGGPRLCNPSTSRVNF